MADLNVTGLFTGIGVAAASACKLLGSVQNADDLEITAIEALLQKMCFLADVGMGLADPANYQNDDSAAIAKMYFVSDDGVQP